MSVRRHAALLLALVIGSASLPADAQDAARWQVPPSVIPVDFTVEDPAPRKALAKTGLAWEIPITFAMLRENLTLGVKVPEAGEVSFLMSTKDALVDIKTNRVDAKTVNIAIRSQLGRMSVEALEKEVKDKIETILTEPHKVAADEAKKKKPEEMRKYLGPPGRALKDDELAKPYIERRKVELGKNQFSAALEEVVTQRPRWATQPQQAAWIKADGFTLREEYGKLYALLLADEHLRRCGIQLDTNTRNFDALIKGKFISLHKLVTGGAGSTDTNTVQALNRDELAGLRKALVVEGICQFVPATDGSDANSQWFNAQRIGVSVTGVPQIRVVGSLDPAQGDRSDWWALVGFQEDQVQLSFPDKTDFRHELYQDAGQRTCLRIIATSQKSVAYTFELRKRTSPASGVAVVVHESPGESNAKFPF
ncbi:MAG: hypothetical protein ABI619_09225 [Betaproteobacteria bacterium]